MTTKSITFKCVPRSQAITCNGTTVFSWPARSKVEPCNRPAALKVVDISDATENVRRFHESHTSQIMKDDFTGPYLCLDHASALDEISRAYGDETTFPRS